MRRPPRRCCRTSGFAPGAFGISGIFTGAALVFFAYIGFDIVATAAEETKNPQRDMPIGILSSLAICTVLYVAVSLVVTGMVKYTDIKVEAPLAEAFRSVGHPGFATVISVGALIGLTTVMMILMLGQSRVFFAMSRDRLLPPTFAKVSPRFGTPVRTTILTGVAVALISTFVPLTELAELVNIGTLFAFVLVAVGVLVLRRTRPDLQAGLPLPGRAGRADPGGPRRGLPDAQPARRDVGPVLRLDGHRLRRLLRVRRAAQPTRRPTRTTPAKPTRRPRRSASLRRLERGRGYRRSASPPSRLRGDGMARIQLAG